MSQGERKGAFTKGLCPDVPPETERGGAVGLSPGPGPLHLETLSDALSHVHWRANVTALRAEFQAAGTIGPVRTLPFSFSEIPTVTL